MSHNLRARCKTTLHYFDGSRKDTISFVGGTVYVFYKDHDEYVTRDASGLNHYVTEDFLNKHFEIVKDKDPFDDYDRAMRGI